MSLHIPHSPPYLARHEHTWIWLTPCLEQHSPYSLGPHDPVTWRKPQLILASLSTQSVSNINPTQNQHPGVITHTWLSKCALLLSTSNVSACVLAPRKYWMSTLMYFSLPGTTRTNYWAGHPINTLSALSCQKHAVFIPSIILRASATFPQRGSCALKHNSMVRNAITTD